MGVRRVWDALSQGESTLRLNDMLDARPRREVGHHGRAEDGDRRVPPRAPHLEETEGTTRNTSSGDAHVGPHRSDVRVCGGQA